MTEIFSENAFKNSKSVENPTAPPPPVSGVAFADHPPPTRKGGQQNETYGEDTVGLGGDEDWRDKQGNININEYKNGEGTIQKQNRTREKTADKSGLRLIDGNSARNYENVARNLIAKALEEKSSKRDQKLKPLRPQPISPVFFENLPPLITIKEAALFLRMSPRTLEDLLYKKQFPEKLFVKPFGKVLIKMEELKRWVLQSDDESSRSEL